MALTQGTFASLRPDVEAVIRLGTRAFQVLSPSWSDMSWRTRAKVLAGSAAADLILVWSLRRTPPEDHAWGPRLAHIGVDVAANIALFQPGTVYVAAVVPAFGLALEAAYSGNRAVTVALPLVCLSGAALGSCMRGWMPWPADPVVLLGLVELLGWVLRGYEAKQVRAARRAEMIDLEAEWSDARAAARYRLHNELGGASLLDDVKNALNPLVAADQSAVVATQAMLQRRKLEALEPPPTAVTLRSTIAEARAHRYLVEINRASTVRPTVDEASAQKVLTARQARELLEWFERQFVTGEPTVRVASGGQRVGSGITLYIGGARCRLRADQAPIELAPVGWVAGAAMAVFTVAPSDASVPPAIAALSSASFMAAAGVTGKLLRRWGPSGRPGAVLVGTLPVFLQSTLASATMGQRRRPDGAPKYPAVGPLIVLALVAGHYWPDLGNRERILVGVTALGSLAVCWAFADHDLRTLGAELVWPAQHFVLSNRARRLIDAATVRAAQETREAAAANVIQQRATAVEGEVAKLNQWVEDAYGVLSIARDAPRDLRELTARRLSEARDLLSHIRTNATWSGSP